MTAVTSSTIIESLPNAGLKRIILTTSADAAEGQTVAVTLANYGISKLLFVQGWVQTTANSVVVGEAPTTAVSSGVLTITIGTGGGSSKVRVFEIMGSN